ncbi:hypothetical protein N183_19340 [Sinorhizobium sp. Sb3]|nr:hypothetical protein N183_19340 [Sinorhizobium sp. Sb3]
MILIPPEFGCRSGEGSDSSGLIASLKYALAAEAPFDTQGLCFRVLGNSVVIEGQVSAAGADEFIRRVAEDIAGADRVVVRVGCPVGPFPNGPLDKGRTPATDAGPSERNLRNGWQ